MHCSSHQAFNQLTSARTISLLLAVGISIPFLAGNKEPFKSRDNTVPTVHFTENKGQVGDQHGNPRPDVLFGGSAKGMVFHLLKNGISYQINRIASWKEPDTTLTSHYRFGLYHRSVPDKVTSYRLDITWMNSNEKAQVQTDRALPGHATFYTRVCPEGVFDVTTYSGVTYKNIYNKIDLHYYESEGALKFDYVVAPYADYRQIRLQVKGAQSLNLLPNGSVLIKTPLGDIEEGAPKVYQNGQLLVSGWQVKENVLSFEIENYDPALELLIDPITRVWGTYYGGSGNDFGFDNTTDAAGNVYLVGRAVTSTGTTIATVGSHQSVYGGGVVDAYVAKFNSNGVRQWSTYYGNAGINELYGCSTDGAGNIYACGLTQGNAGGIATPGSHQSTFGGGHPGSSNFEAFLVKFNANGVRQWGTYYGGTGDEIAWCCANDNAGNVYMTGVTSSTNGVSMATSGAHQALFVGTSENAFLVKFNSSGVRQWGTYYGGDGHNDGGYGCATDGAGNVYMAGVAGSTMNIATSAAHQSVFAGPYNDAFLVKFNSSGVRQWGTYYGGNDSDIGTSCSVDGLGNVYLAGVTMSSNGTSIATAGSHQSLYIGSPRDAFLVKFNSAGVRQWGTYYGGYGIDVISDLANDVSGNIIAAGQTGTSSGTAIATAGNHQSTFGGSDDGFAVQFNSNGVRQWGTYYGGPGSEIVYSCSTHSSGSIYLSGYTTAGSGTAIASVVSHQNSYGGGGYDGFLAKFNECTIPLQANSTPTVNLSLCANKSTTLNATSTGTITWYATATSTTAIGTGNTFITGVLSAGTTYYAESSNSCGINSNRLPITVTIQPAPTISANSGSICSGQSFTIIPTGASSYTYSGGSNMVSPSTTTSYSITGSSSAGCTASNVAVVTVTVHNPPVVSAQGGTICSGNSFTFFPSGAFTYSYSGGSAVVSPTSGTSYSITGTSAEGCISATPAVVNIGVVPLPNLALNSGSICAGQTFTLIPSGASTYTFSGGSNVVSPTVTTSYSVTGTNAAGCMAAFPAAGTITVMPLPALKLISKPSSVCALERVEIVANGASLYSWNTGAQTSSIQVIATFNSTYTVIGTDSNGCQDSASISLKVSECTGISETGSVSALLRIFPNPNKGSFTLELPQAAQITVYNHLAQLIYEKKLEEGTHTIDLGKVASGLYTIRSGPVIKRFVVE